MIVADYCPACGTKNVQAFHEGKLRPVCPQCGHVTYFDPKVAAINFITQDDKVLLVQRGIDPGKGLWALPGGYIDIHEHPQAAAKREAYEETGLDVTIGDVLDVFFDMNDGGVITIAYAATINGGTFIAGDDAQNIGWFTRDTLPELVFTSTKSLVARWLLTQK